MANYKFKAFKSLTINNAKKKLIDHAKKVGIYEDFGQEVVMYLEDTFGYNPYSHDKKQQEINRKIEDLREWCMNYCG